jgi:hypothetical protein
VLLNRLTAQQIDECLVSNADFLEDVVEDIDGFLLEAESEDQDPTKSPSKHSKRELRIFRPFPFVPGLTGRNNAATESDLDKLRSTIRLLVRDWSDEVWFSPCRGDFLVPLSRSFCFSSFKRGHENVNAAIVLFSRHLKVAFL